MSPDRRLDNIQINGRTRTTVTLTLPVLAICGFFVTIGVGVLVADRANALNKMDSILAMQTALAEWRVATNARLEKLEIGVAQSCLKERCTRIEHDMDRVEDALLPIGATPQGRQ